MSNDPNDQDVTGVLSQPGVERTVRVVRALSHSLVVEVTEPVAPPAGAGEWSVQLKRGDRSIDLGRCRYFPHPSTPRRRAGDPPPEQGHGKIVPLDAVIDFRGLIERGLVVPLSQRVAQLPLILKRKEHITPAFRAYVADLGYELQVFRSIFDEIDRSVGEEPRAAAEVVRDAAVALQWQPFCVMFDRGLEQLASVVAGFDKQTSEVHGFYFRKHMWDIILSSEFMARTNLKPRGYAGDSEMMRMIYEDAFVGPTIFSRFMHRHPIRTDAAQAVRNRRALLANAISDRIGSKAAPLRVMSVACGPACEIADIVTDAARADGVRFTLLDQDDDALREALRQCDEIATRVGVPPQVTTVRDSVRTMLRSKSLRDRWGGFDFIYTMGLFDYLVGPVARAVLAKLYDLLDSGGELVVGNFHVRTKTRLYMEYWMDWVLNYRDEDEMLALAADLPTASATIELEETNSQMFLRIKKG